MRDTQTMHMILVLGALMLMPIIPATLLFKALPGTAIVKGLLAGLRVDFSGAFGGYVALAVFFSMFAAQQHMIRPTATWHLRGTLQAEQGDLDPSKVNYQPAKSVKCDVVGSTFDCDMSTADDHAPIPDINFTAAGFIGVWVSVSQGRFANPWYIDDATTIRLQDPIVFRKTTPVAVQPVVPQLITTGGS